MAKENVNVNLGTLLLESRILFIGSEVNPEMANTIVSALLYLDSISHDPIKLYINSPGGAVIALALAASFAINAQEKESVETDVNQYWQVVKTDPVQGNLPNH